MSPASRKYAEGQSPRERIINAARKLFGSRGFHATTTAELASEANVSMGQIYRLFASKDEVVLAIVEEDTRTRVATMHAIFDSVERDERTISEAIQAITEASLLNADGGLLFEILAESYRNPTVAERLETLTQFYRDGIRRLASLARPGVSPDELEAYVEIMMACFIGFGHHRVLSSADIERIGRSTACLMTRALSVGDDV